MLKIHGNERPKRVLNFVIQYEPKQAYTRTRMESQKEKRGDLVEDVTKMIEPANESDHSTLILRTNHAFEIACGYNCLTI
jgi:hypothetical protein